MVKFGVNIEKYINQKDKQFLKINITDSKSKSNHKDNLNNTT
jgi:hypothetical protein